MPVTNDFLASDILSRKVGRRHIHGRDRTEFLEMIGPVGGTHYLVRNYNGGALTLRALEDLQECEFFDTPEEAGVPASANV